MAIYSNIDGTTKPSFKIGTRGIIIEPHTLQDESGLATIAIKKYNDDGPGYVLEIPKAYCSNIRQDGTKTIFTFRNPDGTFITHTIDSRQGGVIGPESAVEGNLAAFADSTGQELKDSGYAVLNSGINDKDENIASQIPTAAAVKEYVGIVSEPLAARISGEKYE